MKHGERYRGSSATPIVLLFVALATVFLFGGSRGHFYEHGEHNAPKYHDELTTNHMAVAMNLSPEHYFLGFYRFGLDADGEPTYEPYNRFPVLGHALVKLATLPWPDDFSARLAAARTLMLAFFAAAATLAYLALCRLTGNRWAALAATLLAFSSYYALGYNDMVATEGVIDLFAVMLAFHGIAVFATEGRLGQLLAKTCVALLLGWHVYALLLPFLLLVLAVALRRRDWAAVRRHLTLGAVALAFGLTVLAGNFTREYLALGGEVAVSQLPSVNSMLNRLGFEETRSRPARVRPTPFERWRVPIQQVKRVAWSVPYAAGYFIGDGKPSPGWADTTPVLVFGLGLAAAIAVAGLVLLRRQPPATASALVALAVSGSCWALAVPNNSWIGFEGMFNVGTPLAFFALVLPRLDRWLGGRVRCTVLAGLAAVPTFVLSNFLMARATAVAPEYIAYERAVAANVHAIRKLAQGKAIAISKVADGCSRTWRHFRFKWRYYFVGHVVVNFANRRHVDFVVSGERIDGVRMHTPDNQLAFLYDRGSYEAALSRYERFAEHGAPVLDGPDYDLYLVERSWRNAGIARSDLLFFRDHCPTGQRIRMARHSRIFVHVWPADANDLAADRRPFGFDDLWTTHQTPAGWRKEGKCYVLCRLPDYDIATIDVGSAMPHETGHGQSYRTTYDVTSDGSFAPRRAAGNVPRSPAAR